MSKDCFFPARFFRVSPMDKKLFLLDGMALVYRAHFAFMRSPVFNSKGQNTSAIYGFMNTLLDLLGNYEASHIAIAFDTREPTENHKLYSEYKAQREAMPEDIAFALPHIERFAAAFNIPVLKYPGYEADDVIGTYAGMAAKEGYTVYMVTPDKDFAQLVEEKVYMLKPGRAGNEHEVIDVAAVKEKWLVQECSQVADILGLWGDASDNIPGVPGYGEKTAKKLIAEYGTMENLIAHADDLKGKQKERLVDNAEQGLLSKQLATINRAVPVTEPLDSFAVDKPNEADLKTLFVEFEFNSLGKRLFGNDFSAGHGFGAGSDQGDLFDVAAPKGAKGAEPVAPSAGAALATYDAGKVKYHLVDSEKDRADLIKKLAKSKSWCFDLETDSLDVSSTNLVGLAFAMEAGEAYYVSVTEADEEAILESFRPLFSNKGIEKIGHNLKFDISVLKWKGLEVAGKLWDTMIAHFLIQPEQRHNMDRLAEQYLGYTPISITTLIGEKKKDQISMREVPVADVTPYACEDADITWQLKELLEPMLKDSGQEKVFYEIEMPLVNVLISMEYEGINLDVPALDAFGLKLGKTIDELKASVFEAAGVEFNLNSPKQLGEVLFDKLQLVEKPKKTKTGQYATNEQVLSGLAPLHPIVATILEYREAAKLKSTYVDALPEVVNPKTGRIHTSYMQTGALTGRLASNNPNLQNIPIRSPLGQEVRRTFIPRDDQHILMAADYSQIELRVMAEMSGDPGMREAFAKGHDIHAATAAKIFDIDLAEVTSDMRRKAKMVNFGIIFGISAFGLSQRLGIARKEASEIIDQYFEKYPQVKAFMDSTIASCQKHGYVETMTGRRRYLRDINSNNGTIKSAAERTAINSPIQGTAADMIKMAMKGVQVAIEKAGLKSRMLLQVHDELVFDAHRDELDELKALVTQEMEATLKMDVPILVEVGTGTNWLEAH